MRSQRFYKNENGKAQAEKIEASTSGIITRQNLSTLALRTTTTNGLHRRANPKVKERGRAWALHPGAWLVALVETGRTVPFASISIFHPATRHPWAAPAPRADMCASRQVVSRPMHGRRCTKMAARAIPPLVPNDYRRLRQQLLLRRKTKVSLRQSSWSSFAGRLAFQQPSNGKAVVHLSLWISSCQRHLKLQWPNWIWLPKLIRP